MVYEDLFKVDHTIRPIQRAPSANISSTRTGFSQCKTQTALALSCRLLHFDQQAYPIFYEVRPSRRVSLAVFKLMTTQIQFVFGDVQEFAIFFAAITPIKRRAIRDVAIEDTYLASRCVLSTAKEYEHCLALLSLGEGIRKLKIDRSLGHRLSTRHRTVAEKLFTFFYDVPSALPELREIGFRGKDKSSLNGFFFLTILSAHVRHSYGNGPMSSDPLVKHIDTSNAPNFFSRRANPSNPTQRAKTRLLEPALDRIPLDILGQDRATLRPKATSVRRGTRSHSRREPNGYGQLVTPQRSLRDGSNQEEFVHWKSLRLSDQGQFQILLLPNLRTMDLVITPNPEDGQVWMDAELVLNYETPEHIARLYIDSILSLYERFCYPFRSPRFRGPVSFFRGFLVMAEQMTGLPSPQYTYDLINEYLFFEDIKHREMMIKKFDRLAKRWGRMTELERAYGTPLYF